MALRHEWLKCGKKGLHIPNISYKFKHPGMKILSLSCFQASSFFSAITKAKPQ